MKRLLSFITLIVVAMCCYAERQVYVVDGFKYLADPDTKEATLIYNENKYSGDVEIPASFTADGIEFKVTALGGKLFQRLQHYECGHSKRGQVIREMLLFRLPHKINFTTFDNNRNWHVMLRWLHKPFTSYNSIRSYGITRLLFLSL